MYPMYTPPRSDRETAIRGAVIFLVVVIVLGTLYIVAGAGANALSAYLAGAVQ